MQIEKSLNRKMHPHYTGLIFVVSRNKGEAYIVYELDGAMYDRPIAAFRLIPYLARQSIPLPNNFLDIPNEYLEKLKASKWQGDDDNMDDEQFDTQDNEES